MSLNDPKIRKALIPLLKREHARTKDTVIFEELGLCQGNSRIDIAVINGIMHGYEIKSERDNLSRLPKQVETYNKIFDKVTIITCEKHLKKVEKTVPDWWAISKATICSDGGVLISQYRKPRNNKSVDPSSVVQLIWRDEALMALKKLGVKKGISSKPRDVIWEQLAKNTSLGQLKSIVRDNIKFRKYWRPALLRT